MKNKSPKGKTANGGPLLRLAERNLERVLEELDAILVDLAARTAGTESRAKTASVDVRKAIQIVFEERHRIDKLADKDAGDGAGAGLDLDSARREIGRRLALLRARSGPGGVSGEPE